MLPLARSSAAAVPAARALQRAALRSRGRRVCGSATSAPSSHQRATPLARVLLVLATVARLRRLELPHLRQVFPLDVLRGARRWRRRQQHALKRRLGTPGAFAHAAPQLLHGARAVA